MFAHFPARFSRKLQSRNTDPQPHDANGAKMKASLYGCASDF